jgi:hypothetical protein
MRRSLRVRLPFAFWTRYCAFHCHATIANIKSFGVKVLEPVTKILLIETGIVLGVFSRA